jgi:hypothetical protein
MEKTLSIFLYFEIVSTLLSSIVTPQPSGNHQTRICRKREGRRGDTEDGRGKGVGSAGRAPSAPEGAGRPLLALCPLPSALCLPVCCWLSHSAFPAPPSCPSSIPPGRTGLLQSQAAVSECQRPAPHPHPHPALPRSCPPLLPAPALLGSCFHCSAWFSCSSGLKLLGCEG